jgi:predicted dehydrogenase
MNDAPIVLAQIGCGYWGPNLLRNFSSLPGTTVKYLVDTNAERRAYVQRTFPSTTTADDSAVAFGDPSVTSVIIATPAGSHFELAKRALAANKHVFVEKPLAMSTIEADELIAMAAERHLTLMVGHTFIYNNAVRYMKKLLSEGQIGEPYYFYSQRLNLGQIRQDVNAWWNLAPHDISILLYLLGDELPCTISAHGMDYIQPGVEDVVFATLKWPNRITASIHVSWLDPLKVRRMTVVGSKKMVVYDDIGEAKIAIYDKGIDRVPKTGQNMHYDKSPAYQWLHRTGDVLLPKVDMAEPLQIEAAHFLECVRHGTDPLTGPRHARNVVQVLEAGQKALKSGGVVRI